MPHSATTGGAADAAATANTLNRALGKLGGRQKYWMTGPAVAGQPPSYTTPQQLTLHDNPQPRPRSTTTTYPPPNVGQYSAQLHHHVLPSSKQHNVRPTPPPPTPPQPPQPPPTQVQPSPQPQPLPTYPSPYSNSPTLPNVLPPQTLVRNIPSPSTVLPSPAPSDGGGARTAESASPLMVPPPASPDELSMDGVRQAAKVRVAQKRPCDTAIQQQWVNTDKRVRPNTSIQTPPYPSAAPTANSHPSPSHHPPQYPPLTATSPSQPATPVPSHQAEPLNRRTSTNTNPQIPENENAGPNRDVPEQQWYSKEYCLRLIETHRQHYMFSESFPWDEKRMNVVQKAVVDDDWVFLMINQVYCVASWYSEQLPPSLREHPTFSPAMKVLAEIMGSNTPLSQSALTFFAQFPLPIDGLASMYPKRYKELEMVTLNFFDRSFRWATLKKECVGRVMPPLMRELVHDLGIASPILQRIVFTSALRHIWESLQNPNPQAQERFEAQALAIMDANQTDFYSQQNSGPAHIPDVEKKLRTEERQKWGVVLQRWAEQHRMPPRPRTATTTTKNGPSPPMAPQPSAPSGQRQQQTSQQQQNRQLMNYVATTPTAPFPVQPLSRLPSTLTAPPSGAPQGNPRARPRLQQTQPRSHSGNPQPLRNTPLLPRAGHHLPQQRLPDPSRFALHQAYLRGATLEAQPAGTPLYQHVKYCVKGPLRLKDAGHKIEKWTLKVTAQEMRTIPSSQKTDPGAPPIRMVTDKSCMLRLRCTKWRSSTLPNEHQWILADTSWIPHSYFVFNGEHLHQRKKLHHGKDMPIDLTPYVHEGENVLEVAINRTPEDFSYLDYLIAIELIGFKSSEDIIHECRTVRHISAAESKSHILKKLSNSTPTGDDADDEIAIVESSLSVSLLDPFSASKIFDVPARGRACLHYDCFDLATFLQTRKLYGNVSAADNWKCPICNGDARPQHLVVDGFMEHVRDELASQGLQHTRAIVLDQEAKWKPKVEVLEGVADRDSPDGEVRAAAPATTGRVIDLSD